MTAHWFTALACNRRAHAGAIIVLFSLGAGSCRAEDLPTALTAAAARAMTDSKLTVCRPILGLGDKIPSNGGPDYAVSVTPADG